MAGGLTPTYDWAVKNAHIKNEYIREFMAEFLGTLLLLFFVVGAGLQALLHPDSHAVGVFGVVFGLMVCVFVFGGISGAHLNPAVSVGLAVAGHLKWQKLPLYWVAQMFGGYLGSLIAYGLYRDHIQHDHVEKLWASLQYPMPAPSIPDFDGMVEKPEWYGAIMASMCSGVTSRTFLGIGFVTEIILTAILLMAVMAVIDKGNMKYPPYMIAFSLCLTVAALAMSHSGVTGTILNPARDLSPRLAAATLGWNRQLAFQNVNFNGKRQEWWIIGVFAPPIGAVLGVLIYNFLVGAQLLNNRDDLDQFDTHLSHKMENGEMLTSSQRFIPRTHAPSPVPPAPYNYQSNGQPVGHFNPAFARDVRNHQHQY